MAPASKSLNASIHVRLSSSVIACMDHIKIHTHRETRIHVCEEGAHVHTHHTHTHTHMLFNRATHMGFAHQYPYTCSTPHRQCKNAEKAHEFMCEHWRTFTYRVVQRARGKVQLTIHICTQKRHCRTMAAGCAGAESVCVCVYTVRVHERMQVAMRVQRARTTTSHTHTTNTKRGTYTHIQIHIHTHTEGYRDTHAHIELWQCASAPYSTNPRTKTMTQNVPYKGVQENILHTFTIESCFPLEGSRCVWGARPSPRLFLCIPL